MSDSDFHVLSGALKPSVASTAAKGGNLKQPVGPTGGKAGETSIPPRSRSLENYVKWSGLTLGAKLMATSLSDEC